MLLLLTTIILMIPNLLGANSIEKFNEFLLHSVDTAKYRLCDVKALEKREFVEQQTITIIKYLLIEPNKARWTLKRKSIFS